MNRLVDRWTLVHFSFWFAAGAGLKLFGVPHWAQWAIVGGGAITWELFELALERLGRIDSAERWWDRWVSDLVVAAAGAACGLAWVS